MRNKLFLIASLIIIASMALGACAAPTPEKVVETIVVEKEGEVVVVTPTAPPPPEFMSKDPTTYTVATFGSPETFDPALCYETAGGEIIQNTHDSLIFYNRENPNEFVPQLALEVPTVENGGISEDGLVYTWKIRPGVKFHDGTEMTVEDVAYTFQRGILQGGTSSPQWMIVEPFFGTGYDDIAAVVADKVVAAWTAKVDELVGAVDLAAVNADVVKKLLEDALAAHVATLGAELALPEDLGIDAFLSDTYAAAADDDAKKEALKTFTVDTISGLEGADPYGLYDNREGMTKVNPDILLETANEVMEKIVADPAAGTVTMKLAQPWAPFIPTLSNSWGAVTSKAWISANGGWDGDPATWQNFYAFTSDEINATPIGVSENGTGPYKLERYTPGEEIVLVANEDYWRTEPAWEGGPTGAPALKTVIIKSIDEFSTRFAMLQAGDADAIAVGSMADWPQMDTLVGVECEKTTDNCQEVDPTKPLVKVTGLESVSRTDMFFTFKINNEGGNNFIGSGKLNGDGIPVNFFSDPHVRKGFAYCFNYQTYVDDVMLGEGVRSINVMLPGMIGYQEDGAYYDYDPEKCQAELEMSKWNEVTAEDGTVSYEPSDNGTISLWETGFRFTATYNTGNTARQTAAQILQTELGAINEKFIVEVTGLPWPTFLKNQRASKLPIFFSGWLEDIHDPHNWVVPFTTGTYGGRQKLPAEIKAKFSEYIDAAVVETDPEKRAAIYHEFNTLYYETAHSIPLFVATGRRYQQRWVQGWYANPIYPGAYFYVLSKQ